MGTRNLSAPTRAQSALAADPTRTRHHGGGLVHDNTRHTTRFVVIGNHLVQHKELSLLAIGLGCHLQSLPTGASADIKTLTARFPEGATRIAAAHLAPGVAAWLERDLTPTAVRDALTTGLPDEPLRRPAALLAHRLTAQLPPPPPFRAPATPPPPRYGLRTCDGCDRAFRAPDTRTHCRDCLTTAAPIHEAGE
ncbi:hypothetical protein ABZ023_10915 [Streptomyces sp. NPDC006367]|uniref:hypothetical protein n=1 Tax=unclassified Streptomyces TaxID=2593676 RepID=UPI00339DF1E9